jgi:hypothetical protein
LKICQNLLYASELIGLKKVILVAWLQFLVPIRWRPQYLDLTPLDFYFWGHMKNLVYEVEIKTDDQLRKRIGDAANQIRNNLEMLNSVYEIGTGVFKCV